MTTHTESGQATGMTRRDVLGIMGLTGLVGAIAAIFGRIPFLRSLIPAPRPATRSETERGEHHWGMVIDLSRCIGCDYCVYACQAVNDVPDDMRWNVHVIDRTAAGDIFHLTRNCMHCQEAPCVMVCPVGATYVREDGIVVMDYDVCIGCRYCQAACPYDARHFNWKARDDVNPYEPTWGVAEVERRPRGVMEKCTFCVHRIDAGLERGMIPGVHREATPACVNICPVEARFFGDLNDPESTVSQILASRPTIRLREELGTEPSVYYIPPDGEERLDP